MPKPDEAPRAVLAAELSEHETQRIETIAHLHAESERQVGRQQRFVERLTEIIGQPRTLGAIVLTVALWIAFNVAASHVGWARLDPPPFEWMQGAATLLALLVTTMVLTTQNRQAKRSDRRAYLDLQVNLVAEQKVAKLIALVEELRRDLPSVRDRRDHVAEAMAEPVDPHAVASALQAKLESKEGRDTIPAKRVEEEGKDKPPKPAQ
jgi:uncharacterized membrane protein